MLDGLVKFSYRGSQWADQIVDGAVRYDIIHDPVKDRWYLDASWTFKKIGPLPTVESAVGGGVVGVDLNDGHIDCWLLDRYGNPTGLAKTIMISLDGPSTTRDGHIRGAITELLDYAAQNGIRTVAVENLNFADFKSRDDPKYPRGKRGRRFRRTVSGLPTAKFRDRLVAMAANRNMWIVAVDPAYTSKWGAQHWQKPLSAPKHKISRHHAASVVIGRRALGARARRRLGVTEVHRSDERQRATSQAHPTLSRATTLKPGKDRPQPKGTKTTVAKPATSGERRQPKTIRGRRQHQSTP